MILFLEDWDRYPTAIADTETPNRSFVRYSGLLKKMGIKNHAFPLALINTDLQGVDPFDPDLTQEQILAIIAECNINPWYYFREVARVPASGGSDSIRFRANRGNMAIYWLFFNHITFLLIQPRQTGKSINMDNIMTYLLRAGAKNTNMKLLTKDDSLRTANLRRLKEMAEVLPWYIGTKKREDIMNSEKITVKRLGNTLTSGVAQASPKAALNLGRGETLAINEVDEAAFVKNIAITLPALFATGGAARDNAKAAGAHYGNMLATTAGYLDSPDGQFVHGIYNGGASWTEHFFDLENEEELIKTVKKNCNEITKPDGKKMKVFSVTVDFNHRQLGYTDEWLRGKLEDAMADGDAALADFFNTWIVGNSSSPIPDYLLERLRKGIIHTPNVELDKSGYIIRWYLNDAEMMDLPNRKIIISLDTSDAVGNDDIAMTIRCVKSGKTIGVGQFNETNIYVFALWLIKLLERLPNSTMIIERRSTGTSILDMMLEILPEKGMDPFRRLFNWIAHEKIVDSKKYLETLALKMPNRDESVYVKYKQEFGYATSGSGRASRNNLYGESLISAIKYTGKYARDKNLIGQISKLSIKNGRIDHSANEKDDLVISWLMGYWFLTNGEKSEFGINDSTVLSEVMNDTEVVDKEAVAKQLRQKKIKQSIDLLIDMLKEEKSVFKFKMIEDKINQLYSKIDNTIIQPFNVKSIIDNIKMEKTRTNRHVA